jgi:hypothetical protein
MEANETNMVMTQEQVQAGIDAGDMDIINATIAGTITIGEPEVEKTVEEKETEELAEVIEDLPNRDELITEVLGDTVKEKDPAVPTYTQEDIDKMVADAVAKAGLTKEDKVDEIEPELSDKQKAINELREAIGSDTSGDVNEVIIEQLATLKQAEDNRLKELEKQQAKDAQELTLNKLFTEVGALQGKHEHFKTDRDVKTLFEEFGDFRGRVSEFIGSDKDAAVDKAVYAILNGESKRDKQLRKTVELTGVEIPKDLETYYQLAEVVDLKNGYKFNSITGEREEIVDDMGQRVNQASLEDAYKLSNFSAHMADAEAHAQKAIQQKLNSFENSATTLTNEEIVDASSQQQVTENEAKALLSMSASKIASDPKLKAKYDQLMVAMGLAK